MFIGGTDAEAETPIFWPPDVKSWLIGKDSDAGRDWGLEEKGTTEDEMAGWHYQLDGQFEWTPGVGDGQGGLACYNAWGHKESDTTEWLNWTEDTQRPIKAHKHFHPWCELYHHRAINIIDTGPPFKQLLFAKQNHECQGFKSSSQIIVSGKPRPYILCPLCWDTSAREVSHSV